MIKDPEGGFQSSHEKVNLPKRKLKTYFIEYGVVHLAFKQLFIY